MAAECAHLDPPVVGGDLGVVAHEAPERPNLGGGRERHEVRPRSIGAQQRRHRTNHIEGGVATFRLLVDRVVDVVEAFVDLGDQPRVADVVDGVGDVDERTLELLQRTLESPDRIEIDGAGLGGDGIDVQRVEFRLQQRDGGFGAAAHLGSGPAMLRHDRDHRSRHREWTAQRRLDVRQAGARRLERLAGAVGVAVQDEVERSVDGSLRLAEVVEPVLSGQRSRRRSNHRGEAIERAPAGDDQAGPSPAVSQPDQGEHDRQHDSDHRGGTHEPVE